MSHCRVKPAVGRPLGFGVGAVFCLSLFLLFAISLMVAGCGGGDGEGDDGVIVAKIGDYEVTKGYYERKLAKLEQSELPRTEEGDFLDTGTLEGRKGFLRSIINKELMAQKAVALGYLNDPEVAAANRTMSEYQAAAFLHEDRIASQAATVTEEEVAEYYANYQTQRSCSFLIANFRDDALEARQKIIDGALWNDVAADYHDGYNPPDGNYIVNIPWGRFDDKFEEAVFALELGGVTEPVETVYGWWILRYNEQFTDRVPPLESIKEGVLNSIHGKRINLARDEYLAECYERYEYKLDEDALWIAYQGLPEDETVMNPETGKPNPQETLQPLNIPVDELDRVFFEYLDKDGEKRVTTLGDYKVIFDKASVFVRPKHSEMLGGMRQKLNESAAKNLLNQECYRLGYLDDPRVKEGVKENVERMMVNKLYADIIQVDEYVGSEEIQATYDKMKEQFFIPETRVGRFVYCDDESKCRAAWQKASEGVAWDDLLAEFETVPQNREAGGTSRPIRTDNTTPMRDALFSLETLGELAEPFQVNDKWAIAVLTVINPPVQRTLDEVSGDLANVVRGQRKDLMLDGLLEEWRNEFPVEIDDDKLNTVRSWEELQEAKTPEAQGLKAI